MTFDSEVHNEAGCSGEVTTAEALKGTKFRRKPTEFGGEEERDL